MTRRVANLPTPVQQHEPLTITLKMTDQPIPQCRICLQQEDSYSMIMPCKCTGSSAYVHKNCLKQWIRKSALIKTNVGQPECQICKYVFSLNKKCKWQCTFKKRKNDQVMLLLIVICLMVAAGAFMPFISRADLILPYLKEVILSIIGLFEGVMFFSSILVFKDAFIIVTYEIEVLPMREMSNEPTIMNLTVIEQGQLTKKIKSFREPTSLSHRLSLELHNTSDRI